MQQCSAVQRVECVRDGQGESEKSQPPACPMQVPPAPTQTP